MFKKYSAILQNNRDKFIVVQVSRYLSVFNFSFVITLTCLEVQMPNMQTNPAVEFSRRINKYNSVNGKIPPRMNRMFSVWAGEMQRREELLKVNLFIKYLGYLSYLRLPQSLEKHFY